MKINNPGKSTIGKAASVAVGIMAVSNILSRLLGFVRLQILANMGGTSNFVDAFSFSFTLPDIINHILAGSALSITFIPIFQKFFTNRKEEDGWRFFSNILTIGTIFFIIFISFSLIYTRQLITPIAGENIDITLAVRYTRIILPAQLFFFWGALLNGVQYAKKKFFFPALTPLLYNVGIIFGGLFLSPFIGIEGFSWGVLIGAFVGNVVVQIPGALKVGMRFRPTFILNDPHLIKWILITIPFMLGLGMTFSNEFLLRFFGSRSPDGVGAVASLDYSYKIIMMIVGIFGQAFAAGIYPFLSQLASEKKFTQMNNLLNTMLTKTAALTLPVVGIFYVLSSNIVAVLLQRGEFNVESTALTAKCLRGYLPGAFFFAGILIVNRVYFAMKKTILPLVIISSSVFICIPIYIILGNAIGSQGVAIASSCFAFLAFVFLYGIWNRLNKNQETRLFVLTIIQLILITMAGAGLCYAITILLEKSTSPFSSVLFSNLYICIISSTPSILFTTIMIDKLNIIDVKTIIRSIKKRLVHSKK